MGMLRSVLALSLILAATAASAQPEDQQALKAASANALTEMLNFAQSQYISCRAHYEVQTAELVKLKKELEDLKKEPK